MVKIRELLPEEIEELNTRQTHVDLEPYLAAIERVDHEAGTGPKDLSRSFILKAIDPDEKLHVLKRRMTTSARRKRGRKVKYKRLNPAEFLVTVE